MNPSPAARKRIWVLRDSELLPLTPGGRRMRMGRLVDVLAQRGHHVTWWASTFDHFQKKRLFVQDETLDLSPQLRLRLMDVGPGYGGNFSYARLRHYHRLGAAFAALSAQETQRPDVIIANFPTIELATAGMRMALAHHIPIVVDIRDTWPDSFADYFPSVVQPLIRWGTRSLRAQARFCFQNATRLVAVSQHMLDWGMTLGGRRDDPHARVLYLGAEPPVGDARAPVDEGLDARLGRGQGPLAVYLGSFGHTYDFKGLIAGIRLHPEVTFVLAGDGPQWQTVKDQLAGLSHVVVLGWLDQKAAQALLHRADILLVPCRFDLVPNKFCEALAWGKPILASGPQGAEMAEILSAHDAGLFYTPGDAQAFSQAIQRLATDAPLRQHMGRNALKVYQEVFDATHVSERYADLIEGLFPRCITDTQA